MLAEAQCRTILKPGLKPGADGHAEEHVARLRFKVHGFSALNARTHIERKRNAVDAQSAEPFLVLPAKPVTKVNASYGNCQRKRDKATICALNGVHGLKAADLEEKV